MKKSKKVLLITFIVISLLLFAGKIVIGIMIRNVQHISVSTSDLSNIRLHLFM